MEEKHKAVVNFDPDQLSEIFDRLNNFGGGGVSVTTRLPEKLKLSEIVGIQHYQKEGKTKAVYRRGEWLYLCVLDTKEFSSQTTDLIFDIKSNKDSDERWEPWELYGEDKPLEKKKRLLKLRCKTASETKEWEKFYGME